MVMVLLHSYLIVTICIATMLCLQLLWEIGRGDFQSTKSVYHFFFLFGLDVSVLILL